MDAHPAVCQIPLALLLNQIRRAGIRKKIQLLIYAPNFISVIVLCGMVRMFLSPVGPLNKLIGSDARNLRKYSSPTHLLPNTPSMTL